MTSLRRTPFFELQRDEGARFVPFAGWELPVQFGGIVAEHLAVRQRVGLFDVSHMGEIVIEGREAVAAMQFLLPSDAGKLACGRALYSVMCTQEGGIVDDLIVYREADERYFLCVNAARCEQDLAHIRASAAPFACQVHDLSAQYAQLALQGPRALELLASLASRDVEALPSFAWEDGEVAGIANVRVARTGYTGEPGVELYCAWQDGPALWRGLVEAGRAYELALCGLAARDTLRLEMKYPLYGNDIDEGHHPLEAGLGWVVKWKKGDFQGRAALRAIKEQGLARRWIGFKMEGRGIPRSGYPILCNGERVGTVTSGTHSPCLGEPIGTGYVPIDLSRPNTALAVEIRGKSVPARVVETPFYKRDAS